MSQLLACLAAGFWYGGKLVGAGEMSFTDMMQVRSWVPAWPVSCVLNAWHRRDLWAIAWLHAKVAPGDLTYGVTPLLISQAWTLAILGLRLQNNLLPWDGLAAFSRPAVAHGMLAFPSLRGCTCAALREVD